MAMKCLFCGATPATGATLYRVNTTGRPGVWACEKHVKQTDAEINLAVEEIVRAIKGGSAQ